jgi:DNA-binding transcriptional ArsR family regulator
MVTVKNRRKLTALFAALADPTRRAIVERLAQGDATVGQLAKPFRVSRPAISKHLRVLERVGLVGRARDGRLSRCRLETRTMRDAADWIGRCRVCWQGQLDRFALYLGGEGT